ncbi:MAG: hypothetical protein RI940_1005, partial [Bacteroidota bacterium]
MINNRINIIYKAAVTLMSSCFFMVACENNINDVKAL